MIVLKEDSKVAQKIRKVEQILREEGVSISFRYDGILIYLEGVEQPFVIRDAESRDLEVSFPSEAEPTKIQRIEDYISGA